MSTIIKRVAGILLFFLSIPSFSQTPEMATDLRDDGKIYVVVAVVMTVLIGLFVYLFITDKKVSKIEKELEDLPSTQPFSDIEKSNL